MPKNLSLFGSYLQRLGRSHQKGFKKTQLIHPIPGKAYGRPPSASSQTGLYHDEDYNYYTKVSYSLKKARRKLKPNIFRKDFFSEQLNSTIPNLRVTTSALHAMDDVGGFDEYILRTSPEELRSHLGEEMKNVMYFYQQNPLIRSWGLPWKTFRKAAARRDPAFARHLHLSKKEEGEQRKGAEAASFSPYFLPSEADMHPERQPFVASASAPSALNFWWKATPELEKAFRRRLGEAKSFDRAHADHRLPGGYRKGEGRGGGGPHGRTVRKRSKTHHFFETRPY